MILREIKKGEEGTGFLIERDGNININTPENKYIREAIEKTSNGDWFIPHPFIVHAVFQKANVVNANGRIYPREILEREYKKYLEKINDRRSFGQPNHPADVIIDVKELSHDITKLWWEGNTLVGELKINMSPAYIKYGIVSVVGDIIANNIYFNKLKLGVSSRGVGSVENKNGTSIVQEDFELICWDIVSDPSTPNAWIGLKPDELTTYIENNNIVIDDKKTYIIEKINNILNNKVLNS